MRSMENLKGYGSTLRDNTVSNKTPTIIDDIAFEDIVRHLEDEFAEEQRLLTSEKNFSRIEGHNIGITNFRKQQNLNPKYAQKVQKELKTL